MYLKKQYIAFKQALIEFLLLNFCVLLVFYLNSRGVAITDGGRSFLFHFIHPLLIFNLGWVVIVIYKGESNLYKNHNFWKHVKTVVLSALIFVGITYLMIVLFNIESLLNETTFFLPILLFSLLNISLSRWYFEFSKKKNQNHFVSKVLIIGAGERSAELIQFKQKFQYYGYEVIGVLSNQEKKYPSHRINALGQINDLSYILTITKVDEIFINLSALNNKVIKFAIETADYHGVRVSLIPEAPAYVSHNLKSYTLDDLPVFQLRKTSLDKFSNFLLKRVFDFMFSTTIILLLLPLYVIIALLIRLESKGPILYMPIRKGEAGNTFKFYKFRTMYECDDPVNGTKSTAKDDPRITRIGKFLRKYDMDELPQFFNVLKGNMSVVGPRPHRVNLQKDFRKIVNDYMVRHYVKPGITGWAQVNGWRGPTVTDEQKKERVKHDLWYIENWTFGLDIKIIFLTVFSKRARKNAF